MNTKSPKRRSRPTRAEHEILEVLWDLGRATIRQLLEGLPEHRRPGYTTVQSLVNRLEEKGLVERVEKVGNAHLFRPLMTRRSAHRGLIDDLIGRIGSARPVVAHLLETGQLTLEDLRGLEHHLEEEEGEP